MPDGRFGPLSVGYLAVQNPAGPRDSPHPGAGAGSSIGRQEGQLEAARATRASHRLCEYAACLGGSAVVTVGR